MTDPLEAAFNQLRREYLAEAPARLAELRKDITAFRAGEPDATESLKMRFHRLSGSGGSYGFPEISDISRDTEQWLKQEAQAEPTPEALGRLDSAVGRLSAAFNAAASVLGLPPDNAPHGEFGWRARVIAPVSPIRQQVQHALEVAGYLVQTDTGRGEPAQVAATDRPDLLVIVKDPEGDDPYATASAWSGAGAKRPRAIVLADPAHSVDPVRAIAAGIDLILPAERIGNELPRYAKTLARIGAPPARVLLVDEDPLEAHSIVESLQQVNVEVNHCSDGITARDLLARETPDLLLMDIRLPGLDGISLARLVRQDPRFGLIPIVFLTRHDTIATQIEALNAGADHFLTEPVDHHLLTQLVINRAERGRRLREMVHRDGLTGLLNHATLMAELEHTLEYSRRHGETFAFIMADVDHFKRVNDQYGHLVGDQVLLHVSKVLQATARASDLIGRYGGEEFGLILRRTDRHGAGVLASKLRTALSETPATISGGRTIAIRICMGIACYPQDGITPSALAQQADQALYRAKTGGRDRVEYAKDNPTNTL
jgi:diguanylate cyclase (GGDEF)-like protein